MAASKLKRCKVCGAEIAKSAKTCPHCGAKLKRGHSIIIAIFVIIILFAIIGSSGENDEPIKIETAAPTQQTVSTPKKAEKTQVPKTEETPMQTAEKTPEPVKEDKKAFYVGETAEIKNVKVTYIGVTESTGSAYNKPTDGNVFLLCEFEIANDSDKEIAISSMMCFEAYCDDYTCNYSLGALLEKGNKNQLDGSVAAGKKFKGVVGYEVPADWKELEVIVTPDFWSGKDITFIAYNE